MIEIRPEGIRDCVSIAWLQVDIFRSTSTGILPPAYPADFTYEEQERDLG